MNKTEIPDSSWTTYQSHPASGLAYQESKAGRMTAARVVQDGHEIVSPDFDVDHAWRQYNARVSRWIENAEREAVRVSCTCGAPDVISPALHPGTCPVWQQHHDL